MEEKYKVPSDLTLPIHNKAEAPNPASAGAEFDSGYMDGSVQAYSGANPGRDQDRSRVDECIPACYHYTGSAVGTEGENETGTVEGY